MTRMRRIGVLTGVCADDPEFKGAPYGKRYAAPRSHFGRSSFIQTRIVEEDL